MERSSKIFVAGHRGLVGSALLRRLARDGHTNVVVRTHADLDLAQPGPVEEFFHKEKPEYVFLAAARVGGIQVNQAKPVEFLLDNLSIQSSVLRAAHRGGARRLLFYGGACLYPRVCPQPMKEDRLMTGPMEPTSVAYSTAKLAGLVLCDAFNRQFGTEFLTALSTTVYGPNDNFDLDTSHVLSALLRRFHEAKSARLPRLAVWGSGEPVREFLHADDLADASLFLMNREGSLPPSPINIGTGRGIRVRQLAEEIRGIVGYEGEIDFDRSKPDGAPEKVLDISRMKELGWAPKTALRDGLRETYEWYLRQISSR